MLIRHWFDLLRIFKKNYCTLQCEQYAYRTPRPAHKYLPFVTFVTHQRACTPPGTGHTELATSADHRRLRSQFHTADSTRRDGLVASASACELDITHT